MRQTWPAALQSPISRRRILGGAAAVPLLGLTGSAFAASSRPIRVRVDDDIQILDPCYQAGGAEEIVNRGVLVTLTRFLPGKSSWVPYAAETIAQTGPRSIAFRLRDDLFWNNGYGQVTAEDVKFSFERVADPKQNSPWQYAWSSLDHIEVTDRLSGIFHFKREDVTIWGGALPAWAGHVVCKRAVLDAGGRYAAHVPAACGPYIIGEWDPKRRVRLVPNPAWKGPPPPAPKIDLIVVQDAGAAELALEAGELDITKIQVMSVPRYQKKRPPGSMLIRPPGSSFTWLGQNVEHPKLTDIRVRRAIQYAVDVDAILYAAYGGAIQRATGFIPPWVLGARKRNIVAKRDLAKSRWLLKEAGKAEGLKLTLSTINTSFWMTMAEIIQDNLRDVGIDLEILDYDPGVFWSLGVASPDEAWRKIELKLMTIPGGPDPSEYTIWFTSQQIGQYNWERIRDPIVDRLNNEAMGETDPVRRAAMYREIQDRLEESGAFLYIANDAKPYLAAKGFTAGFAGDDGLTPDLIAPTD